MKTARNRYRIAILAGVGLLTLVLALMVTNLFMQLRDLSVADNENMQWTISQLDTEFANLHARLAEELLAEEKDPANVQLRLDIALSRLGILNSGRAAALFEGNAEVAERLVRVNAFAQAAIEISDRPGALTNADLEELLGLTKTVRPDVRRISVIGLSRSAAGSEGRRANFSSQLTRTGGIAIALMLMMAVLLALLDRLLDRAARRDRALLASSRQLASTVAASLDAIVTADSQGRIIDYNTAAEDVFGWSRDDVLGKAMEATIIPHRMRQAHHDGMSRYLETGQTRVTDAGRIEMVALRKTGEEFPVELNITTAQDDSGTIFIAYIRDISERKINEDKLVAARDRAERTDKAKSQFLAVMSHEMRTPLNGILGVLDLLKTTKLSGPQRHYAEIATASSEILLEHVNEALDITRIEAGALLLTSQDFDLGELVSNVVDVLEPLAREKNLELRCDMEDAMRMGFHGDSNRIRQILTNLIGNAIKFTDEGGITLTVTGIHGPTLSSLRFDVADTGVGVAPEHQDQVFEDFVALAHAEGRQSRGDGLGLSISRKIARQMGGDISLTSTKGQGSTFSLTIALQRRAGALTQNEDPPAQRQPRPCEVLIVEDNSINRSVLADMLTGAGHRVSEAVNGRDGLEKAGEQRFDIIFMDISMPVMDGIEATRQLRAGDGPNAATHIVGLTAHGKEEYRNAAEASGMDRFYTKPIRLASLESIFAAVSEAPYVHPHVDAQPDALLDLLDALGPANIKDVGDRFFAELTAFMAAARDLKPGRATDDFAETAHKVKGAAVMLGQDTLIGPLEHLEHKALFGDRGELMNRIDALVALAETAHQSFARTVASYSAEARSNE